MLVIGLFCGAVWLLGYGKTAFAGEITIRLGEKVEHVDVHVTKVGDIEEGEMVFCPPFDEAGMRFRDIKTAEDMKKAAEKLSGIPGDAIQKAVTQKDTCVFKDLEPGVYLVAIPETASYGKVDPFLIALPTYVDGAMRYDITSEVKVCRKPAAVKTGDYGNVPGFAALFGISLFAAAKLIKRKK